MKPLAAIVLLSLATLAAPPLRAADDILIADFEGDDYGDWKSAGEAFGPGPARGTLPGQMHVDGFKGKGLVNSFHKATAPPARSPRRSSRSSASSSASSSAAARTPRRPA